MATTTLALFAAIGVARGQPEQPARGDASATDAGDARDATDAPTPPTPADGPYVTAAADSDTAPRPGQTSGVAVPERRSAGSALLWIPRVILFVPRWTAEVVFLPARGTAYLIERYQLRDRLGRLLSGDSDFGLQPIIKIDSDFGVNAGVKLIHKDAFGHRERVRAKASIGGESKRFYGVKLSSGALLSARAQLVFEAEYELQTRARFYGIGNADLGDGQDAPALRDPRDRDAAVFTRYGHELYLLELGGLFELGAGLSVGLIGALTLRDFDSTEDDDATDVREVFDTAGLAGFDGGANDVYGEVELIWDSRRYTQERLFVAVPNTGWKISGFGGYARGTGGDSTAYARYGLDIQRFVTLSRDTRIVALRGYLEGVTGGLDDVPFASLPSLGGSRLGRGYPKGRFRDRILAMVSAEYHYPIARSFSGFLFADVGRVYPRWNEFSLADLRPGYGLGLQVHNPERFLLRFQAGSSPEGGVQLQLNVNPVFKTKARTQRF